ncbi:MAG: tetraacyldisaccharide 4'-kinase [Gammaproteobacteria bacterium RBG_16_57_12]|nr:MAG: tetraacyldisaccharide 4'-kinase [Gammaproteobacteria bacterium RBG_16_57_12]
MPNLEMNLEALWYGKSPKALLLLPLSKLFSLLVSVRRRAYRLGLLKVHRLAVPVIVVGNVTVGGTGKTPLVAYLVDYLQRHGYRPGIVSRGYGGEASLWPQQVRPDSDPRIVGDEAVLLARRCRCPMAVGPDRVAAAQALLQYHDCNIIVSDDGLQHYALGRDIEIVVIDGIRRFGNGLCLPAGPLREPVKRIQQADMVVVNGLAGRGEYSMQLSGRQLVNLTDARQTRDLDNLRGQSVHAIAGIGNPKRFFDKLQQLGIRVIEHPFPDHHPYHREEVTFNDDLPVLMTEKDAVKCERFAGPDYWYLPVNTAMGAEFTSALEKLLKGKEHG